MYSSKQNIQQMLSLMLAHGITDVVLSPGSRNAPLIHTFSQHPGFKCYTVVDERSAAYFALGMILELHRPVAVCCTSGTALLNYSSATAEAFYQKLPLLVISADRPAHWVGQADGQTINQKNVLANFVKRSVTLPEINNVEDEWLCNRLGNEAMLALTETSCGPVHVNIPLSEPLYTFDTETLPNVRVIHKPLLKCEAPTAYIEKWNTFGKRMVVVGQMQPNETFARAIADFAAKNSAVIIAEHTANIPSSVGIDHFEQVVASLADDEKKEFAPELLISIGGHIVSKRLKQLLRKYKPQAHWHIGSEIVDTYQSLTDLLNVSAPDFISKLAEQKNDSSEFYTLWENRSTQLTPAIERALSTTSYCDLSVFDAFFKALPEGSNLHLGNSTPIRYSQLFSIPNNVNVFCNRGTSGIDGVVSTFVGHASQTSRLSFLAVGELSFLYDSNGLWNRYLTSACRIMVVNNGGGGIFRLIDGPSKSEALEEYIEVSHKQSVKGIAEAFGVTYLSATNNNELQQGFAKLTKTESKHPILLEVFTPKEENTKAFKLYYENLKTV